MNSIQATNLLREWDYQVRLDDTLSDEDIDIIIDKQTQVLKDMTAKGYAICRGTVLKTYSCKSILSKSKSQIKPEYQPLCKYCDELARLHYADTYSESGWPSNGIQGYFAPASRYQVRK